MDIFGPRKMIIYVNISRAETRKFDEHLPAEASEVRLERHPQEPVDEHLDKHLQGQKMNI